MSVIHSVDSGGGYLPQCMLGYTPLNQVDPLEQTPPGPGRPHPPGSRHTTPPDQTDPPRADPPESRHPHWSRHTTTTTTPQTRETLPPVQPPPPRPGRPPREADSSIRSTSGRFASYWHAFLLGSAVGDIELFLKWQFQSCGARKEQYSVIKMPNKNAFR